MSIGGRVKTVLVWAGLVLLAFLVWGGMSNDAQRGNEPRGTFAPENSPADR